MYEEKDMLLVQKVKWFEVVSLSGWSLGVRREDRLQTVPLGRPNQEVILVYTDIYWYIQDLQDVYIELNYIEMRRINNSVGSAGQGGHTGIYWYIHRRRRVYTIYTGYMKIYGEEKDEKFRWATRTKRLYLYTQEEEGIYWCISYIIHRI